MFVDKLLYHHETFFIYANISFKRKLPFKVLLMNTYTEFMLQSFYDIWYSGLTLLICTLNSELYFSALFVILNHTVFMPCPVSFGLIVASFCYSVPLRSSTSLRALCHDWRQSSGLLFQLSSHS